MWSVIPAPPPVAYKPHAKAIYAPQEYLKFGEGASKNFGFLRHLTIGATLGLSLGLAWKTWHWNEKRFIAQYYADLARKEAMEQADYQAGIQAKFAALEEELLG